jgi:hypothetical protein
MTVKEKVSAVGGKISKLIWDFLTDKNNDGDEKRFLGFVSVVMGLIYPFISKTVDDKIMWAYLIFGGTLLGVAAFADKIKS